MYLDGVESGAVIRIEIRWRLVIADLDQSAEVGDVSARHEEDVQFGEFGAGRDGRQCRLQRLES
jgi:hypothetical protein